MSDNQKKRRIKLALTLITFAALLGTAYAVRHQIFATIGNLGKINSWALFFILPLEIANYFGQAQLYRGLFRILGDRFRTRPMYRLALELNLVNNIFPSGGVSGFSYLSYRMRSEGVSTAKATLVQLMRFIMIFISFQVLMFVGLVLLAIEGKANTLILMFAGSLATLLFIGTIGIAFVIGSKNRINSFFTYVTKLVNSLIHIFRRGHPETINISKARVTFTELHENYMHIRRNLVQLRNPLISSFVINITEIAAIYMVYVAFGNFVNPGAVILAYAIANFAGLVSVLPGGIGIYEALMTGVMTAGGVPLSVSLPATVMYRIVTMSIQLPPGYYFYQNAIHAKPIPEHTIQTLKNE